MQAETGIGERRGLPGDVARSVLGGKRPVSVVPWHSPRRREGGRILNASNRKSEDNFLTGTGRADLELSTVVDDAQPAHPYQKTTAGTTADQMWQVVGSTGQRQP